METNHGGIFITGASSGIGKACARRLTEYGYTVFAGVRTEADAELLKKAANDSKNLIPVIIDIVDTGQIKAAEKQIIKALGNKPFYGLINNAGIGIHGPLEFIKKEDLRYQMEVNVTAHVTVTQAFLPHLRKNKGRIINIGSVSGFFAFPMMGPYCASKFALEAVSDVFRRELMPWGIKVALIEPGPVSTKIWGKGIDQSVQLSENIPQAMALYKSYFDRAMELAKDSEKGAKSPEIVVKAVMHALRAKKPKIRYLVGSSAWPQKIISMLPGSIQDRIVAYLFRNN